MIEQNIFLMVSCQLIAFYACHISNDHKSIEGAGKLFYWIVAPLFSVGLIAASGFKTWYVSAIMAVLFQFLFYYGSLA